MLGRYRSCIKLAFSVVTFAIAVILLNAMPVHAAIKPWPSAFRDQQMAVSGGTQYGRVGGHGPAVLLLHGFGDTGDMWVPLAEILVRDHTVIVPDLRGMGLSSHQDDGYEKTAQARDLAGGPCALRDDKDRPPAGGDLVEADRTDEILSHLDRAASADAAANSTSWPP